MYDLVTMGEVLIDFLSTTLSDGREAYLPNPGGAPANVAAAAAHLGRRTAFLGKVGADSFGQLCRQVLEEKGVDVGGLRVDPTAHTTLAFVHLDEKGNRNFSFCRDGTADVSFTPQELDYNRIRQSKIFHYGTVSLVAEPSRTTTIAAVQAAREAGVFLSFDANLRENLWPDRQTMLAAAREAMSWAQFVKLSEEELWALSGQPETEAAITQLRREYENIQVLAITRGADGAIAFSGAHRAEDTAYDLPVIDTTGAGDAYVAAFLSRGIECGVNFSALTLQELEELNDWALTASSLSTIQRGAIPSYPDWNQVEGCRKTCRHRSR